MRLLLIVLALYAAAYVAARVAFSAPEDGAVRYPPDMLWLYALMWPASQADAWITGTPTELQPQRDIRDVLE